DPDSVVIRSGGSATVEFTCGKQKGQPVVIEYKDAADGALGTLGDVTSIEFR
ncbi:MAG: hypothetical protein JNL98_34470, partial [Bryobacterales bacterium]|nr:hypothetical protein [Bryobacterales bacterium]